MLTKMGDAFLGLHLVGGQVALDGSTFIEELEKSLARRLTPQKPGPKPKEG